MLLVAFSAYSKGQTLEKIIANYINFSGGEKQWGKIKTIISLELTITVAWSFRLKYAKAPNWYKYIVGTGDRSFIQSFNGAKWMED